MQIVIYPTQFSITPDERRSKSLKEMAKNRLSNISSLKEPYRIIEEHLKPGTIVEIKIDVLDSINVR